MVHKFEKMNLNTRINFLSIIALLLIAACTNTQTPVTAFDPEKYDPPYTLIVPEGWGVERFGIPIEFAPSIPYRGVEDLRFAPGWPDAKSDEYWTYAFLWYLEGKPEIDAESIEKNLTAYYNGLVGRNIESRKIPQEKLVDVRASIEKQSGDEKDILSYSGKVEMLDYMEQKPITLNCIVHIRSCPNQNNTFAFYEISPQPLTSDVWKSLDEMWTKFECSKTKSK
jgi:hypothetical protein